MVVGASVAGLLAARSLSESFEEVLVLERDELPDLPMVRKGVPQSGHVHGLLARGREAMDELLEGFSEELTRLGAPVFDVQEGLQWWVDGRPLAAGPSGMLAMAPSRPLLEFTVRRRVAALANVRIRADHVVTGLVTGPTDAGGDGRITGVQVVRGGRPAVIEGADLVVDASGRGARSRYWLEQLGFEPVDEERIETQVTYVTRRYRRHPFHLEGRCGTSVGSYPGKPRSAFVLAQEDDSWIATITGRFGEVPPTDDQGMLDFVADLDSPDVATVIRDAEPLGEPLKMRSPASVRVRYDRMPRIPEGFLVVGDAMCAFNPVYGQGMTVAALEALLLARLLKEGTEDLSRAFFAEASALIDVPWSIVVSTDLRFPQAVGDRSTLDTTHEPYLARLRRAAAQDPELATAFLRVAQLMDPPSALFAPAIVSRVETAA